jgi:hypothetical protein
VVLQRLKPLGITRRDVVAVTVFTTQSVTAGLEQMRAVIEAAAAPLRFALGRAAPVRPMRGWSWTGSSCAGTSRPIRPRGSRSR